MKEFSFGRPVGGIGSRSACGCSWVTRAEHSNVSVCDALHPDQPALRALTGGNVAHRRIKECISDLIAFSEVWVRVTTFF